MCTPRDGGLPVSIHASARDATTHNRLVLGSNPSFNPRVRAGRDHFNTEGVRFDECFNPRVRAGRDEQVSNRASDAWDVSIHASARDATY